MSALLERLRNETRSLHEQTENLFYTEALQKGTLSSDAYQHLLRTHFVFHQALESALDRHPEFFQAYELGVRRKTPWLLDELTHLAEPIPQPMPHLFLNWSPTQLVGAAYVGEGSMLGGAVIGRLLAKNSAIQPLLPHARFYQGYGPETGKNWKSFGVFVTQQEESQADTIVEAAQQTFTNYQTVFRATVR